MVFVELFTVFALIGVTSFGGMSMVPLINAQMISHGWMSATEVLDIVAIAEMTPGSLGFNCATFAGMRVAGILGAAVANLGVLAPTFTITLAAGMFMRKFQNSRYLQEAMYGIRQSVLACWYQPFLQCSMVRLSFPVRFAGNPQWLSSLSPCFLPVQSLVFPR